MSIKPWAIYHDRFEFASAGKISLPAAFAQVLQVRLDIQPYDIPAIFAAAPDDGPDDAEKDLVEMQSRYLVEPFIGGTIDTFVRPIGGGGLTPIKPALWEVDDPLPRFATGIMNLEHWSDGEAEPTHRIFVDKAQHEQMLLRLPQHDCLSDYQIAQIGNPLLAIKRKMAQANAPATAATNAAEGVGASSPYIGAQSGFIPLQTVMEMTNIKRSKIYDMMKYKEFPKQVKNGSRSSWVLSEVRDWIEQRKGERG